MLEGTAQPHVVDRTRAAPKGGNMAKFDARAIVFDMYGTVVDVGAVAEACRAIAPDPVAFNGQWRAKQNY